MTFIFDLFIFVLANSDYEDSIHIEGITVGLYYLFN